MKFSIASILGGVNLTPQEVHASLYHSDFMDLLERINLDPRWRQIIGLPEPDLHGKDVEVLLRAVGMLIYGDQYREPMVKFLNVVARDSREFANDKIGFIENLISSFLDKDSRLPRDIFHLKRSRRFNISMFDAVFRVICDNGYRSNVPKAFELESARLVSLKNDPEFNAATQLGTAKVKNIKKRSARARDILLGHF